MAKGFKHGGSGASGVELNFTVNAYPSEVELNTATPEDTTITNIGVVTTNPITGWYFASEQPENMVEGELWFKTAASSGNAFNALKENNVMVYPIMAKQMVSGELVNVTGKFYIDGKWTGLWDGSTLYDAGNQMTVITGGWEINTNMNSEGYTSTYAVFDSNYIVIGTADHEVGIVSTVNKIDITNFSTLKFDIDTPDNDTNSDSFGVIADYGDVYGSAAATVRTSKKGRQVMSVDISSLSGLYYVFADAHARQRYIYKVWLE